MTSSEFKSARHIAFSVLKQFTPASHDAAQLLHKFISQTNQKAQATDLVFGTIRNQDAVDMVIEKLSSRSLKKVSTEILPILRIAAYEIIFAPQTAQYAIVNEAVATAKSTAGTKTSAFVNAVLRQICRNILHRSTPLSAADPQKTLPQNPDSGCEFDIPILPDLQQRPAQYLSDAFSLPLWLVQGWLEQFGFEQTRKICFASNRRPQIFIRVNTLKTTPQKLVEEFRSKQIEFDFVTDDDTVLLLKATGTVTELPGFAEGYFIIQDSTAAKAVKFLSPVPNSIVIDLCAAPGGKTTQLAELMQNKGTIIATDIDKQRLEKVFDNCERLGATIVKVVDFENLKKTVSEIGPADAVLLDAPCSNTGVLARRVEVRLRIKPKTVSAIVRTQLKLLETATSLLKAGGKICYSTCSIQKQENDDVVQAFLATHHNFSLKQRQLTLPSVDNVGSDGGFIAILERN